MAANSGSAGVMRAGSVRQPSLVVMAYTGHAKYATMEPPTFVVVGDQDGIAPSAVMERRVEVLQRQGAPVEYRKYKGIGHGFGVGTGTNAEGWVSEAFQFWSKVVSAKNESTSPRECRSCGSQ